MQEASSDQSVRINRYLSQAGFGSRRKVEELVVHRRVQVDGETVTDLSTRVDNDQTVRVDGKVVHPARTPVVFALNKPVRVLVSESDPEGRPLAIDLVRPLYSGRLFSVGRLDFLSSGLLLFTNDGELAQELMRPASAVEREYVVETSDPISDEVLESFSHGVAIEGVQYRVARYRRHTARRVSLVLEEGKNREIRRVFAHFRLKVRRIYRNRYGPISLGRIPDGEARQLTANEVERLRAAAASTKAPKARRRSPTSPRAPKARRFRPAGSSAGKSSPSSRGDRPPQRRRDGSRGKPGTPPEGFLMVVAIDGPAGTGKSTISRRVADKAGVFYLNSGRFYRAITWKALSQGKGTDSPQALIATAADIDIQLDDDRFFGRRRGTRLRTAHRRGGRRRGNGFRRYRRFALRSTTASSASPVNGTSWWKVAT